MRYRHDFPAKRFLEKYPEDFAQFLQRCLEMATFGEIRLEHHGHQLRGDGYRDLHQFNLKVTRSWGYKDKERDVYLVLHAAKKRTRGQEPDYDVAWKRLQDYLRGPIND
jgi:hypothetical protein